MGFDYREKSEDGCVSKKVSLVTASIIELDNGKFSLQVDRTQHGGKRDITGFGGNFDTQEEAIERGTNEIKRFLMPVVYSDEPLDLEWEMPE